MRQPLKHWAANWSVVVVVIIESPCSSTEECEYMKVSCEAKPNDVHPVQDWVALIEQLP